MTPAWMVDAACRAMPTAIFHPADATNARADIVIAKRVCAACDVRNDCLDWAITNAERRGIWGGMTRKERLAEMRNRRTQDRAEAA